MRRQAVRTFALVLVALLAASAPARAATITFADLAQAVGANGQLRPASEVRLRVSAQSGAATTQNASAQSGSSTPSQQQQTTTVAQQPSQTPSTTTPTSPDPTLSQSGGNVQTVDLGDVTGTVCDCGEIPVTHIPKGGFPWWTLAGIPIICVSGICTPNHHDNTPECVTGCTPPPPPSVPEPATLLLFGSGLLALGAGARRRYGRKQLEEATLAAATEEV